MNKSSNLPQKVTQAIARLLELKQAHSTVARRMLEPPNDAIFMVDLFATATLNRSLGLLVGFCSLIKSRNFVSAAPLIRLQLDNVLRFSALSLVAEPHNLATRIFQGEQIRRIKDSAGKKMTDQYLVKKLAEQHSWANDVYKGTSGYIHLSEKHFYNAMGTGRSSSVSMKISEKDKFVPDNLYLEAISAFDTITQLLVLSYITGWVETKNLHNQATLNLEDS